MVHIREPHSSNSSNSSNFQSTRPEKDRLHDKAVMITDNPGREVVLRLSLFDAEGIDDDDPSTGRTNNNMKFYCVVFGLNTSESELWTPVVVGQPDPVWRRCWSMTLEDYPWSSGAGDLSLRVEVVRVHSEGADPGTSKGMAVVGRAEIPLPKRLRKKKFGRFQLVRREADQCKAKGTIGLVMELLPLEDYEVKPPVLWNGRVAYLP